MFPGFITSGSLNQSSDIIPRITEKREGNDIRCPFSVKIRVDFQNKIHFKYLPEAMLKKRTEYSRKPSRVLVIQIQTIFLFLHNFRVQKSIYLILV